MARAHYFWYITNEEGQPVNAADVKVYIAGTTDPVKVFLQETSITSIQTLPQVTSDINGFFQFWIADEREINGYDASTKFTIKWSKPGIIDEGSIEYIDFITPPKIPFTIGIVELDWYDDDGVWSYNIEHGQANAYPIVLAYNDTTNMTYPVTVTSISVDMVKVSLIPPALPFDIHVTVIG